jgi:hypothetical protein
MIIIIITIINITTILLVIIIPSHSHSHTHRQRTLENDKSNKEAQDKKDAKDEKMEALLRKVDADFLAMIKEAEDDESKAAESTSLEGTQDFNEEKL